MVLLGSLAFMFLLLSSVMFYYRRRKAGAGCGTSAGYLPAAVTDMEQYQAKTPGVLWSEGHWEVRDRDRNDDETYSRNGQAMTYFDI